MQQYEPADAKIAYEEGAPHPIYYYEILKKRKFYAIISFILVFTIGSLVAIFWPPLFLSEGRILVQSQQIPTDLVRPTITAAARERVQVIEQRVMTRDNLLGIMDKFQVFSDQQQRLSRTELLSLMQENTVVKPLELDARRRDNATIAVTIGFTHRRADVATKVANELITLFLNEDARNRAGRATETTRFLAREAQRIETELAAVEKRIADVRQRQFAEPPADLSANPLTLLRAELAQKSSTFSASHPEIRRIRSQIAALEKLATAKTPASASPGRAVNTPDALEGLQYQQESLQKSLEGANQKLSAARLGESLERDQFGERLEVLEQAVTPQAPIKPNRTRLLAFALMAAFAASFASVFLIENFDRTIRGSRDLVGIAGGVQVVNIPYIATKAELTHTNSRKWMMLGVLLATLLLVILAAHFLYRPLDELWFALMTRLSSVWPAF